MPLITCPLVVEMNGGNTYEVVADQRDYARLEALGTSPGSHSTVRYLGWSVMTRLGLTKVDFETFNFTDCVEVRATEMPGEEEAEGEQGLDPGRTTTSAGSTSPSRAARVSRSRKS